jgi:hypothetical protein
MREPLSKLSNVVLEQEISKSKSTTRRFVRSKSNHSITEEVSHLPKKRTVSKKLQELDEDSKPSYFTSILVSILITLSFVFLSPFGNFLMTLISETMELLLGTIDED